MSAVKDEIAKNIRLFRKRAGLTQRELAQKIGVNNSSVSNWESGQNSIDIEILYKVCTALNISANEVYGIFSNATVHEYSDRERNVVIAYRNNIAMQSAVDKLLGIDKPSQSIKDDIAETISTAFEKNTVRKSQ